MCLMYLVSEDLIANRLAVDHPRRDLLQSILNVIDVIELTLSEKEKKSCVPSVHRRWLEETDEV